VHAVTALGLAVLGAMPHPRACISVATVSGAILPRCWALSARLRLLGVVQPRAAGSAGSVLGEPGVRVCVRGWHSMRQRFWTVTPSDTPS
jgi:hypothetical protein